MSEPTPRDQSKLVAWSDDTALMGPEAPKWNGQIEHLICYLLTVHKRFGNTRITANLQWGATAMWKQDELREKNVELERTLAAQRTALLALSERIRREGMQGVANSIEEIVK